MPCQKPLQWLVFQLSKGLSVISTKPKCTYLFRTIAIVTHAPFESPYTLLNISMSQTKYQAVTPSAPQLHPISDPYSPSISTKSAQPQHVHHQEVLVQLRVLCLQRGFSMQDSIQGIMSRAHRPAYFDASLSTVLGSREQVALRQEEMGEVSEEGRTAEG